MFDFEGSFNLTHIRKKFNSELGMSTLETRNDNGFDRIRTYVIADSTTMFAIINICTVLSNI